MLIRLLQQVTAVRLRQEVDPANVPPPGYAVSPVTDGTDKVLIKSHLTMFVQVRAFLLLTPYVSRSAETSQGGLWVTMHGENVEGTN